MATPTSMNGNGNKPANPATSAPTNGVSSPNQRPRPRITARIPNSPGSVRSSASTSNRPKVGSLKVSVLSAYDLTQRDPPSYVSVTVGNQTVKTGPPVQRHRDRNSFKFSMSSTSSYQSTTLGGLVQSRSNHVRVRAPLATLYGEKAIVKLVYEQDPTKTLVAEYALEQLKVHEKTWLILHLESSLPAAPSTAPRLTEHGEEPSGNTVNHTDSSEDNDNSEVGPTLRIQMTLDGPYRTEIAAVVNLCNSWFHLVDAVDDNVQQLLAKFPRIPLPDAKFVLIPAAPILALAVVSLPVVLGVLLMGLPMFLPIFVVVGTALLALLITSATVYSSTRGGRTHWQHVLQPVAQTLLSTKSGQRLVYQTGPRPTPVNVARLVVPDGIWGKLIMSLAIDAAGSATYLIPVAGEGLDIGWAPMQTILLMAMYDTTSPNLKYLSFVEEILPLTDIVPSATLGWLMEFAYPVMMQTIGLGREESTGNHSVTAPSRASSELTPPMTPLSTPV